MEVLCIKFSFWSDYHGGITVVILPWERDSLVSHFHNVVVYSVAFYSFQPISAYPIVIPVSRRAPG